MRYLHRLKGWMTYRNVLATLIFILKLIEYFQ
ncbi:MAG: hypothetical protein RLZ60_1119 [Pseudomonadota bacterium]|jgi:hypothetical protein